MDTSAGYYQAPRPPRVPLDEVLIKLHPEGFHQSFEADGLNVGAGGLSMRASVLPQVGSTLRCQLDHPVGGEAIEMIGRVVWAHESGEHAGEFGIRFTHLSDDDQRRIETLIQRWGRSSAKGPTVRLQLDGVDQSIVAELRSEAESGLTVEQPLPFLAIGSGVRNEASGRRGHLEAVELRMDDETPRLVLSIGYQAALDAADSSDSSRDTLPDEPPVIRASRPSGEVRAADTPRIVRYERDAEELPQASVVDRLRDSARSMSSAVAQKAKDAKTTVGSELLPRLGARITELFALIGRFVAALRAQLDEKPRRKQVPRSQAARAHLKNTRRSRRRFVLLGAMVVSILLSGWGIYVWAAGAAEEIAEPEVVPSAAKEERPERPERRAGEPESPAAETAPATAPRAATSPVAAAPVERAPLPPEPVRGTSFGAKKVSNGETYVLRMSNPVTVLEGIVEDDGFSVTIPGSLSLSRAGPIAAAHPDIEHASILNRGEFSELTIRFVAGRRPVYRVEARGPGIAITVAR